MQKFSSFIKKNKYFLLFVGLELIAILFTIQSHSYHKSQFINSANEISGNLYEKIHDFSSFYSLRIENEKLAEENTRLRNALSLKNTCKDSLLDSLSSKHRYISAKVISNNYTKRNNVLTINKGRDDGIGEDMGVISGNGIVGVVSQVSKNYATVISVLHSNTKLNAKLKKNFYFGTLSWNGLDYKIAQLIDMQRQAKINIGDSIVTGGKSIIFPENILIGTVKNFESTQKSYKKISINLATDMSNLGYVKVIQSFDKEEIYNLQNNE
ncbi:MAG: rod shape-determining protein MreC [Flavicella sp.]